MAMLREPELYHESPTLADFAEQTAFVLDMGREQRVVHPPM